MKKILIEALAAVLIFLFFTLPSNAIKLEENNYYSGTIKDNHRNNIPLPPGDWELTEIVNDKIQGKGVTAGTISYNFFNSKIGYVYYEGPTGTSASADRWRNNKTPTFCNDNPIVGKTNISGKNNTEWCAFYNGEYIEFLNYTTLHFRQFFHIYYIKKNLLKNNNKSTIQSIGSQIFDQVRKNKAGDLSFLSKKLDFDQSASFSSNYNSEYTVKDLSTYTDEMICLQATSYDGKSWEKYAKKYYNEAMERNLTISKCNNLTNRIIDDKKVIKESNKTIESKLTELKALLDKGLISQDLYEIKSLEILEKF